MGKNRRNSVELYYTGAEGLMGLFNSLGPYIKVPSSHSLTRSHSQSPQCPPRLQSFCGFEAPVLKSISATFPDSLELTELFFSKRVTAYCCSGHDDRNGLVKCIDFKEASGVIF